MDDQADVKAGSKSISCECSRTQRRTLERMGKMSLGSVRSDKNVGLFLYNIPGAGLERTNLRCDVHRLSDWRGFEREASRYAEDCLIILSRSLFDNSFIEGFRE